MKRISLAVSLVLALVSWPAVSSAASKLAANVVVKSVSASSLTVSVDGKDMTFSVDAKTKVVGKGIGTSAAAKGKGGRASIADLLSTGDRVTVTYQDVSGTLRAASVERTAKAVTTK